jgi:ABC-2 type transport system permease protein
MVDNAMQRETTTTGHDELRRQSRLHSWAKYLQVFGNFSRNSLIRDMTFRVDFIIQLISSTSFVIMNLGFYLLIYQYTNSIAGWSQFEFFVFIATTMLVNSMVQAFFMPNVQEFSELIRTGNLDFALLKPIDTQFLISLQKVSWPSLGNFGVALILLFYSLGHLSDGAPSWAGMLLYPVYVLAGASILYSVMIALAATSIWLGRNQSLYDFWFYITNFSRYPMGIYDGRWGTPMRQVFTFVIPILIVINVPAGILAKPLDPAYWKLALFAVAATVVSFWASRLVFQKALRSYRSASS